ncbi:hypothetical protein [Amycolatopsis suaedae]|uniref:Nucleoside hydrolase n=1 Tax=Amycolatopsis suaedae TaxID=2510978 RepID=A0A4Q7JEB8_9PSEU|nr:hypothetical protein [Amycolatopsis suaedae]RZQ65839.1 hypothetical protein EWH70_01800 [Amycolatopsis suaedae]
MPRTARIAALALVAGLGVVGAPVLTADRPVASERACLVVDSDVGLDDYRALAALLPRREVRAVVVTEGISGVHRGATAVSMFLAGRGSSPPVLPGLASPAPPDYDWLPAVRAGAERMNDFLRTAVPAASDPARLTRGVAAAVRGCGRVEVLVLGPWTSYPRYAHALGGDVRVVASGRPVAEHNPDNFNCAYDLAACRAAPRATYVDLPAAGFEPTADMVDRLEQAGLPGLLRASMLANPAGWAGTRLWDDAAALYLLEPGRFSREGAHLVPAVPEREFRDWFVDAVNKGR